MTDDNGVDRISVRRKVLIADVDPIFFELAADHFANSNTDLIRAGSAEQMATALERYSIDVVVIAISLADQNGIGLIYKCRMLTSAPVIALAAGPNIEKLKLALNAGANSFVVKPVNWPLFECQIDYLLAHVQRNTQT